MSCNPELVTGFLDAALDEAARSEVETHLASCPSCREQSAAERDLRARLRSLPLIALREGFEEQVRRRLRSARPSRMRWALPLAASLTIVALWARTAAPVLAWEIARDHVHCFGGERLPAQVWSGDGGQIAAWFEGQGTSMPPVPAGAADLTVVGARYCPLLDGRILPHVYYVAERRRHVSLYVIRGSVRIDRSYAARVTGETVRLERVGEAIVGLVGEHPEDVEAFARTFERGLVASLEGWRPAR